MQRGKHLQMLTPNPQPTRPFWQDEWSHRLVFSAIHSSRVALQCVMLSSIGATLRVAPGTVGREERLLMWLRA